MTGNATTHIDLKRITMAADHRGGWLTEVDRTEIAGTLQMQDIVQALGAEAAEQRCIEAGLETLAMAGHPPVRAVVSVGDGRQPALDFYVDADTRACCALDRTLQQAIACRFTSVLPPGLAVSVLPLAVYARECSGPDHVPEAQAWSACACELLSGGEMHQRLAVVCAWLSVLHDARGLAERLGYLQQTLLEQGCEALSWRLRRHRSVEGRALAQALEGLSRAADGALYEFGTRYSRERASYQIEQMRQVHDQIARFRDSCRLAPSWPDPRPVPRHAATTAD
ncbi:conserved hypothetical protein [Cupriavidus taiwanensis LMG 19424]|uniref:Uncharacterized protein n=3 Tax=Cupriavidus taiwanensis TaxID=164546 RepID=B3RAL4_CUPTR|nr:conserved hypothetical protein [Cupriavidus taiwanensis LMG 19424]SOZ10689.1 conserved hypothetical protein [Cupriavidus taiwanensis]SOZ12871.1 conserved hypothetical protein [Cupriavidus taiwanensis]SOZ41366.1 conserved hypothetical protein [Cupriavidus taiwanensis]SPC23718.1 conserved hypothetical protein [Cupriavidus taiwanensis]